MKTPNVEKTLPRWLATLTQHCIDGGGRFPKSILFNQQGCVYRFPMYNMHQGVDNSIADRSRHCIDGAGRFPESILFKQHACVRRYLKERQDYCAQPTQTQRKIASNLHVQDIARREQCKSNKQNGRNVVRNIRAQVSARHEDCA